MRRVRIVAGTTVRLAVILVLAAALVAVPLLVVYRSDCRDERTSYSVVAPWDDAPRGCRNDNGFEILRGELGLD